MSQAAKTGYQASAASSANTLAQRFESVIQTKKRTAVNILKTVSLLFVSAI